MPLLQQVNCVLITSDDFQAFARNPHGLIPGGNRLIFSRKITLIGLIARVTWTALRRRFPDLSQDTFGIGQVALVILSDGTSGRPWVGRYGW